MEKKMETIQLFKSLIVPAFSHIQPLEAACVSHTIATEELPNP